MVKARQILELLTGPTSDEVEDILAIIRSAPTWQDANEKLEGTYIRFDPDDPAIKATGAVGAMNGEWITLNPLIFRMEDERLRIVIEHELTHRDQMLSASASGGDPLQITADKLDHYSDEHGRIDIDKYLRDPLEMQALARNAVGGARRAGKDVGDLLRRGKLDRYAPMTPLNRKRFGKYAYQMHKESTAGMKAPPGLPIVMRDPQGQAVHGVFHGYYDLSTVGLGIVPAIGYPIKEGVTHGMLRTGWAIVSEIPSFEEWKKSKAAPTGA